MSSDVHLQTDSGDYSVTSSQCDAPKHISKSVENIHFECLDTKPPKGRPDGHHRSQSHSLSSPTAPGFQHSNSHQLISNENFEHKSNGSEACNEVIVQDSPKDIDIVHNGKVNKSDDVVNRLIVVSSKVRNISSIRHALLPGVTLLQYNCDSHSLDDIEYQIAHLFNGRKIHSVAFILSCCGSSLQLLTKEEKLISKDGILDKTVQEFFIHIVQNHFTVISLSNRIDFLGWYCLQYTESTPQLVTELQTLTGVSIGLWRDLSGCHSIFKTSEDAGSKAGIRELYFRLDKLRNWSGRHQQSLAGFERIRTVGKGAYGAAVLYKKKDDESLVILKEINMHDLNASERQLALNEVSVLAMLDHPNIISYYDSFEEDGVLMIEMEYADNGTLAQYLVKQDHYIEEKDILSMFQQIVAAIRHIHSHNILHRDLKTDNIFLTKEGVVKIGDFGISKMMGSANKNAQTVLGTPYYISPEMCEGKQYSFKSDIWALGCVLHEMACLQKTFEGSNLPAVVNKIMKGQFTPVKGNYSEEFKELVKEMLQKNPEDRPEANTIMYQSLPHLMSKLDCSKSDQDDDLISSENLSKKAKIRSVLYYLESSTATLTCINDLPPRMKIKHMAVGPDHVIVTTVERQVYTWGNGGHGQLGHGDTKDRYTPTAVEGLKGKSITLACCGLGYSVFGSDNGLVLTCGDGSSGCLGHGDWCTITRPRLIESLLSFDVMAMASGLSHVVVIGREGDVMSWGEGTHGQLGLGTEENHCVPSLVYIAESVVFNDVQCGIDGTMLISDVGGVYACGNNDNNKLGLNNRQGFLMAMKNIFTKTEVDGKNVPTPVRALARHRVIAVSMGVHHTAVIVEPGHVISFGKNADGQLGTQNTKSSAAPVEVKALEEKCVNNIQCGEHFTVASTRDHELYYWGLRYTIPPTSRFEDTTSQSSCNDSTTCLDHSAHREDIKFECVTQHLNSSAIGDKEESDSKQANGGANKNINNNNQSQAQSDVDSQGFRPLSSLPRRSLSASSQENPKEKEKELIRDDSVIILKPMEIIKLKQGNEKMLLGNIYCHGENLFIQVETTAPPPRRRTFRKRLLRRKSNLSLSPSVTNSKANFSGVHSSKTDDYSCSSETSEMDTHSTIPPWLKEELTQNVSDVNDGNEADDTSGQSEEERRAGGIDSSMSSIQINRAITPVATDICYSPRLETFISGDKCSPRAQNYATPSRNWTYSVKTNTKAESNFDASQTEMQSDSSSGEVFNSETAKGNNVSGLCRKSTDSNITIKQKVKSTKAQGKQKGLMKGKGQGEPFREKSVNRGLVSDVTAKRREESLLFQLERIKQEKKQADARVHLLEKEKEKQQILLKQEVEKLAEEREKSLLMEVEKLRLEIDAQNSLLEDREKTVGQLQQQLNIVMADQQSVGSGVSPRNIGENSSASSSQFTPRAERSPSILSKKSTSKMCLLQ